MKYYREKDHGINLTLIGVVNFLRNSLKIECCKNLKKRKIWDKFRGSFTGDYSTCLF